FLKLTTFAEVGVIIVPKDYGGWEICPAASISSMSFSVQGNNNPSISATSNFGTYAKGTGTSTGSKDSNYYGLIVGYGDELINANQSYIACMGEITNCARNVNLPYKSKWCLVAVNPLSRSISADVNVLFDNGNVKANTGTGNSNPSNSGSNQNSGSKQNSGSNQNSGSKQNSGNNQNSVSNHNS
ncbi:28555_t:CDS:1, partial [Gigaspora margarita]